jgi:hypothetical protein
MSSDKGGGTNMSNHEARMELEEKHRETERLEAIDNFSMRRALAAEFENDFLPPSIGGPLFMESLIQMADSSMETQSRVRQEHE